MRNLIALLLLSPFASADMDKICSVYVAEAYGSYLDVQKQIRKNVEEIMCLNLSLAKKMNIQGKVC